MRIRPPVVVLAGLAGAALLGACSSEDRVGEAEEGIAQVLAERLDGATVVVTCPEDADLEEGASLSCDVAIGDADPLEVPFEVGASGSVRLAASVLPTPAVEQHLRTELAGPAEGEVEVDCGDDPLLVRDIGGTFMCDVTRITDGVGFTVAVEVQSLDGSITFTVATTTTTATTVTTVPAVPAPPP